MIVMSVPAEVKCRDRGLLNPVRKAVPRALYRSFLYPIVIEMAFRCLRGEVSYIMASLLR